MSTFFVENKTRATAPHDPNWPGVRIDANDGTQACALYAAGPYGAQPGDILQWHLSGPNYIGNATVAAGPQTASASPSPALPPVGG